MKKGLYLLVTANGSKLWRMKYRLNGKEKKLALRGYLHVGLKGARARRDGGFDFIYASTPGLRFWQPV